MKNIFTVLMTDIETAPVIEFCHNFSLNIDEINAIVLEGWGIHSFYDINYRKATQNVHIRGLHDKFEVGKLFICKPCRYFDQSEQILAFLQKNKHTIETIFCAWDEIKVRVENFCKENEITYQNLGYGLFKTQNDSRTLYQIRTPIIFVSSISEFSDKFYVEMSISNHFTKKGYHSTLIGTKPYSELLGATSFPEFIFKNNLSIFDKVTRFNHFIWDIEIKMNPDVIVIGIPGELDGFINGISTYFDDVPYVISKAVKPDITIVNVLYNEIDRCNEIKNMLLYKYGWNTDGIFLSNIMLDLQLSKAYGKHEYLKITDKLMDMNLLEKKIKEIEIFTANHIDQMCNMIEDRLANYGEELIV